MRWVVGAGCALALSVACRGGDWIIAGELPPEPDAGAAPGDPQIVSDPDACPTAAEVLQQRRQTYETPGVAPEDVGRWRGVLGGGAASGFPGASVELQLDASGRGTLTLGDESSAVPAAPDGTDGGYLCDAAESGVVCGSISGFVGGFAYPIEGARSRGGVVSFVVVMGDPWGAWCAQQAPVPWEDTRQACGYAFGVRTPAELRYSPLGCSRVTADGAEEIDCALMYALEFCACARDACYADFTRALDVGLERSADGASLIGSLWYENELQASPITLAREP